MTRTSHLRHPVLNRGLLFIFGAFILIGGERPATASAASAGYPARLTVATADVLPPEPAGPEKPPTMQETLLALCQKRGYGEDCAKTLLGMVWKESLNDPKAIGDGGRARGWFQIHYRLHKISVTCAEDLICSAEWTLNYLERNGYKKYPTYAVQCHNGCNIPNGYAASVKRHGQRLWKSDEPYQMALAK
jgi:hypothetical protein